MKVSYEKMESIAYAIVQQLDYDLYKELKDDPGNDEIESIIDLLFKELEIEEEE